MSEDKTEKALNIRQGRFAALVATGVKAPKAIEEAGYEPSTSDSAKTCASRLMKQPDIKAEIERVRNKYKDEIEKSFETLVDLRDNAENEAERRRCAEGILDRLGAGKEVHKTIDARTLHVKTTLPPRS